MYVYSVANQVRACDMHHLCHVDSLASVCTPKLHVHAELSFTCGKCTGTCVHPNVCIKFKLNYTVVSYT